jgi:hypothetical protein
MVDMEKAVQAGKNSSMFSGLAYSRALKELVTPDRFPDLYPVLMSGAYTEKNQAANTVGDDFEFGLERILDGIEQYLDSKKELG